MPPIEEGMNFIINRQAEIAAGEKETLSYTIPGSVDDEFDITFLTGHREPPSPYVPVRLLSVKLFRPGEARAQEMLDGTPFWEEVIGTAQLAFLLAAKERIKGGTKLTIDLENIDPANAVTTSITLVGEVRLK